MDALRGIGLLLRTPRLWGLAVGPMVGVIVVYVLVGVAGAVALVPHLKGWLGGLLGGEWLLGLSELALVLLYLLVFPFLFTLLGGIFFGLVFEPLSLAVEREAAPGVTPPATPLRFGTLLRDALARLALSGALGPAALAFGFVLGPIPGVLAAALVGLLDYTSPAYLRRGYTLGPQARRLFRPLDGDTIAFGVVAGLLSLVPLAGVLLMPGLIAGGTLLAMRRERV
jgi:CysZ protein